MIETIDNYLKEVELFIPSTIEDLESFRLKYNSKKGLLNQLFDQFKTVPSEQKKEYGQKINFLKTKIQEKLETYSTTFSDNTIKSTISDIFNTSENITIGSKHPISIIRNRIVEIFNRIGFTVSEGPEIEDDWHVFTSLNFPLEHPARDMQDTFFIDKKNEILLRTHTSSVQIREMKTKKPPLKILMPGRVFRNEQISARAHCIFHQVEGLYIDENVSFADLKQALLYFSKEMFGEKTQIRLRPSYFPFTEPSAEMDISCSVCGGKGCNICKHTGWVEILGCGMVDPSVLINAGIDSNKYTGYAFGMGIERIAILQYQIKDIRLFFENDIRFIDQFKSTI